MRLGQDLPRGIVELLAEAEHDGGDHHDSGDFHGFLLLPAPEWRRTACLSDAVAGKKVAGVLIGDERLRVVGRCSGAIHHHEMIDAADRHPAL